MLCPRFILTVLLTLAAGPDTVAVDGLEKWHYTDRPAHFGKAPEPVFKDSRIGSGCSQKRWKPDSKGYYQAVIVQVPCRGKFQTWKPIKRNDPTQEFRVYRKPHRPVLENMLLEVPARIGAQMLRAPWETFQETRSEREQYPKDRDGGFLK